MITMTRTLTILVFIFSASGFSQDRMNDIENGVNNEINLASSSDLLEWATNSSLQLTRGLEDLKKTPTYNKRSFLARLVNQVLMASGSDSNELLMRSVLTRAKNFNLIIENNASESSDSLAVDILRSSIAWAIELYPEEERYLRDLLRTYDFSENPQGKVVADLPFGKLGLESTQMILSLMSRAPNVETRLALLKESMSYLYNDMNRDITRRRQDLAPAIYEIGNAAVDFGMLDSQGVSIPTRVWLDGMRDWTQGEKVRRAQEIEQFLLRTVGQSAVVDEDERHYLETLRQKQPEGSAFERKPGGAKGRSGYSLSLGGRRVWRVAPETQSTDEVSSTFHYVGFGNVWDTSIPDSEVRQKHFEANGSFSFDSENRGFTGDLFVRGYVLFASGSTRKVNSLGEKIGRGSIGIAVPVSTKNDVWNDIALTFGLGLGEMTTKEVFRASIPEYPTILDTADRDYYEENWYDDARTITGVTVLSNFYTRTGYIFAECFISNISLCQAEFKRRFKWGISIEAGGEWIFDRTTGFYPEKKGLLNHHTDPNFQEIWDSAPETFEVGSDLLPSRVFLGVSIDSFSLFRKIGLSL